MRSGYCSKKRGNSSLSFRNIYTVFKKPQLNVILDSTSRKKTDKCYVKKDTKTGKFLPYRKKTDNYSRKKTDKCDTSRIKTVKKENIEIIYRDSTAGSPSACSKSQASPASIEAYKGYTIKDQAELRFLREHYGQPIIDLIKAGEAKIAGGVRLDEGNKPA